MKKTLRLTFKVSNALLTIAVLIILPLVVFTLVTSKTSKLAGIQSFVILSGSMEPAVNTGSVVFTKINNAYQKGDIIAFSQGGLNITHRVEQVTSSDGKNSYITKGDANKSTDSETVSGDQILGKSIFHFPYLGKLILFLNTIQGFLVFVVLPIVIFIGFELWNIKKELEKQIEDRLFRQMFAEGR